jgi:hypothetical protein
MKYVKVLYILRWRDIMYLGKCPYCEDGQIEVRDKEVRGKKVKLYACSNANWYSEDGEMYELTSDSTCDFKIWQNALARYGKWLTYQELRTLLNDGELELELLSKKYGKKIYYNKTIILDKEYGVSVIW